MTLNSDPLTSTGVLPSLPCLPSALRLHESFLTVRPVNSPARAAPQHHMRNACQLSHACGLASSAFARHYLRNHGCFLFLWVLRCFTSPRSLLLPYIFRQRSPDITPVSFEVSLFGDPRIEARLPAPRGLSQVTTSFIGSWCLGIHRLPLVACYNYKDARVHCEVLNTRATHTPPTTTGRQQWSAQKTHPPQ